MAFVRSFDSFLQTYCIIIGAATNIQFSQIFFSNLIFRFDLLASGICSHVMYVTSVASKTYSVDLYFL